MALEKKKKLNKRIFFVVGQINFKGKKQECAHLRLNYWHTQSRDLREPLQVKLFDKPFANYSMQLPAIQASWMVS